MSVSRVSISVVYGPISMKSGMKVGLWTLATEKILQSSYLDDRCQGNEKTFSGLRYWPQVLSFVWEILSSISICLPKMSKIYHAVLKIGP